MELDYQTNHLSIEEELKMDRLIDDFTLEQKANLLEEMDTYLRDNLACEDSIEPWLMCGVPDGSKKDDFLEFAEDDEMIQDCLYEFVNCILLDKRLEEEEY
jgi:hypothetical protein